MFEKLKKYIHRIKRHRRNKNISRFADNMFLASRAFSYKIGLNPLVYAINNLLHNYNSLIPKHPS